MGTLYKTIKWKKWEKQVFRASCLVSAQPTVGHICLFKQSLVTPAWLVSIYMVIEGNFRGGGCRGKCFFYILISKLKLCCRCKWNLFTGYSLCIYTIRFLQAVVERKWTELLHLWTFRNIFLRGNSKRVFVSF